LFLPGDGIGAATDLCPFETLEWAIALLDTRFCRFVPNEFILNISSLHLWMPKPFSLLRDWLNALLDKFSEPPLQ